MLKRKWQIDHDHRSHCSASDDLSVVDHLFERGGKRGTAASNDHRHAISHEHAVDSRSVNEQARRPVVGRHHRERTAASLGSSQIQNRDASKRLDHRVIGNNLL